MTYTDPVTHGPVTKHTLFIGNDNDFLATLAPPAGNGDNPNQFFVFAFDDTDLPFTAATMTTTTAIMATAGTAITIVVAGRRPAVGDGKNRGDRKENAEI